MKGKHTHLSPILTGEPSVRVSGEKSPSLAALGSHPSSQAEVARFGIALSPPDLPEAILPQKNVQGHSNGFTLVGLLCFPDLLATGTSLSNCL